MNRDLSASSLARQRSQPQAIKIERLGALPSPDSFAEAQTKQPPTVEVVLSIVTCHGKHLKKFNSKTIIKFVSICIDISMMNSVCSAGLSANQLAIFFSHTKSASATSHQPTSSIFFSHYIKSTPTASHSQSNGMNTNTDR